MNRQPLLDVLRRLLRPLPHSRRLPNAGAFNGGLSLLRDKPGLDSPIVDVSLPSELVFPLLRYRAAMAQPLVVIGQRVNAGQTLGLDVLCSADGIVTAIEPRSVPHPSGETALCVVIAPDAAGRPLPDRAQLDRIDALDLDRLRDAGVGGLGGAGYPLHKKLSHLQLPVRTLVINAAECEPGIACDEATMQSWPDAIVAGCQRVANLLGDVRSVIVIESDKRAAVAELRNAIERVATSSLRSGQEQEKERLQSRAGTSAPFAASTRIEIVEAPPVYPSGAETLTVRLATGIVLRHDERPIDRGILCINVATALAAERACLGYAQLQRIVTVSDDVSGKACQARVAFGTPLEHVLAETGMPALSKETRLKIGGPLSGYEASDAAVPVTATVNRIARERQPKASAISPCIRCTACSEICPVDLLPQELYRHASVGNGTAMAQLGLQGCLTCGCCDLVCPSSIPLTATFRFARDEQREADQQKQHAQDAEARHRRRQEREARPAEDEQDAVTAALARVRGRRRTGRRPSHSSTDATGPTGSSGSSGSDDGANNTSKKARSSGADT